MIYTILNDQDRYFMYLKDDPVRPYIPHSHRIGKNKSIFIIEEDDAPSAITCVSYTHCIPENEDNLFDEIPDPTIAVFYTIWSYQSGAGRRLILNAVEYIKKSLPEITQFVTLSPKTIMAHQFHTRNGATVFRENETTMNYEYKI